MTSQVIVDEDVYQEMVSDFKKYKKEIAELRKGWENSELTAHAFFEELQEAKNKITELEERDKERLELLIKKGEDNNRLFKIINDYRIGIDDLLNALRPHADDGDVEAGNVMASLLSIKRTAHRTESKETGGKEAIK